MLDEKYFHDKWFYELYDRILWDFSLTKIYGDSISHDLINTALSDYIDNLQSHAQGEQKIFLPQGYNSLMGTSAKRITSADILSFIYALRCNYVHQGKLPDSNNMPIEYKEIIIEECVKYLICYCSIAYLTVIEELN